VKGGGGAGRGGDSPAAVTLSGRIMADGPRCKRRKQANPRRNHGEFSDFRPELSRGEPRARRLCLPVIQPQSLSVWSRSGAGVSAPCAGTVIPGSASRSAGDRYTVDRYSGDRETGDRETRRSGTLSHFSARFNSLLPLRSGFGLILWSLCHSSRTVRGAACGFCGRQAALLGELDVSVFL